MWVRREWLVLEGKEGNGMEREGRIVSRQKLPVSSKVGKRGVDPSTFTIFRDVSTSKVIAAELANSRHQEAR